MRRFERTDKRPIQSLVAEFEKAPEESGERQGTAPSMAPVGALAGVDQRGEIGKKAAPKDGKQLRGKTP